LDSGDGHAAFHGFDDAVVVLGVKLVAGLDEDEIGAHFFGIADGSAGFYAVSFGLVAGGDAASSVGHHGDHGDGAVAEIGARLLLDGGEVGVEVDEEPVDEGCAR
jgi:hypothetical protein